MQHYKLVEIKRMGKEIHANSKHMDAKVVMLIYDKTILKKPKNAIRD